MRESNPDIAFFQESEIPYEANMQIFELGGYDVIVSDNRPKRRLLCYIKSSMKYEFTTFANLEMIKISTNQYDIYGLYRPFKLPSGQTNISYITNLISSIVDSRSRNKESIICGDINLDYNMKDHNQYHQSRIYETWLDFITPLNLKQYVNDTTWHRIINGTLKESILDHLYTSRTNTVELGYKETQMSDHKVIIATINKSNNTSERQNEINFVRKWSKYTKNALLDELSTINWNCTKNMSVQEHTDFIDQNINSCLNKIAPEIKLKSKEKGFNWSIELTRLNNAHRNLWKKFKRTGDVTILPRLKELKRKFKTRHRELEREKVRKQIKPHDPKSFWNAVNSSLGKNQKPNIPNINHNGVEYQSNSAKAEMFANFFEDKILKLSKNTKPEATIEPPTRIEPSIFFTPDLLDNVFKKIKPKKCYGFDRTPMIAIKDGCSILKPTILDLLNKIYSSKNIPNQWKISRITPIHKKGSKSMVENYRPINNLCSLAKVFETCVLLYVESLEDTYQIDFTGSEQHGFKKRFSTTTAMLQIQAKITETLEEGKLASLTSLDLSAAFDVVDHQLLLKRMKKTGIPNDIIELIKNWLINREAFVEINGDTLYFFKVPKGTVQGSVIGPLLFAIYVKDILSIEPLTVYADDNYLVCSGHDESSLRTNTERSTKSLINFLQNSGLKVNEAKTELITFGQKTSNMTINLNGTIVKAEKSMKVLGVIFDHQFNWTAHINETINKLSKVQFGLRCLRKYFDLGELLGLVTSLGMSKL